MVLEHAPLDVIPGREAEFENAFAEARIIIESMPGFLSLRILR
ncbi:MAG: antibiotic biosynthesis monooxygenase family protein, partial [Actinomycetota bacterium]